MDLAASPITVIATGACDFTVTWWLSTTRGGGMALGAVARTAGLAALLATAAMSRRIDASRKRVTVLVLGLALILAAGALVPLLASPSTGATVALAAATYALLAVIEMLYLSTVETTAADAAPPT